MTEIPRIISVDDHVVEPPDLWTNRLPKKYADRAPRVERDRGVFKIQGGSFSFEKGAPEGDWGDWWIYDDLVYPFPKLSAAIGFDNLDAEPVTFDQIRPGCWKQKERLEDMAANHMDASICYPNVLPRFCGQAFLERADKELALLCVKAYNDWIIDEWCAGDGRGRLIPLTLIPLWDAQLAADEIRRCADKGSFAVAFTENPTPLGLPSVHDKDRFWDPFFAACEETGTVICMHIGSSSKMPSTSADAPPAVGSTLTFANSAYSLVDWLMSGVFTRFPKLTIAYSEGQIGWLPYVLERADIVWEENRGWGGIADTVLEPPSELFRKHVYGCFFNDAHGLRSLEEIGVDNVTYESDYPHSDSTWPDTRALAEEHMKQLSADVIEKIVRGNAIRMLDLDQNGRWKG